MCLPGCCGTRSGAKIAAVYTMLSGAWYGIQAIFAFTDTLVLDSLHGIDGVMIFLVSCLVLSMCGVVLMSGARQLSRAKAMFWLVLFLAMLSVRIIYLGMLVAEIRYEEHDVHRVFQLLGPTIMTTVFLLADLWSIITVVQFLRDLRANRYSHKRSLVPSTPSASLAKSVFAWHNNSEANHRSSSRYAKDDNTILTAAQMAHLPPGLQKAYASAMASGRPFTTKDYHYLMMQYDLFESSQQQQRQQLLQQHQHLQQHPQQHHQQQQQGRPSTSQHQQIVKAISGNSNAAGSSRSFSMQQQQQQAAALRRFRREDVYNDSDVRWDYLTPAITAGYLAVQCMDSSAFDGGDMSSALAAVDI